MTWEAAQAAKLLPAGDAIEDAVDEANGLARYIKVKRNAEGRRLSHRYSRDIRAALRILADWFAEWLKDYVSLERLDGEWTCTIEGDGLSYTERVKGVPPRPWEAEGQADTLALAICRAMLDVADKDEDDGLPHLPE